MCAKDRQEVRAIYRGELLPLEYERIHREARRRKDSGEAELDLLYVTVGTQSDSPALATLASPARFVVLLHTESTRGWAEEVVEKLARQMPRDPLVKLRDRVAETAQGAKALSRIVATSKGSKKIDPGSDVDSLRSPELIDLVAMLLESASRRFEDGAYDVAALLAYRAMELVPQRRLAKVAAIDPSNVDWEALAAAAGMTVAELVEAYNKKADKPEYQLDPKRLPKGVARVVGYALLQAAFPEDVAGVIPLKEFAGIGESRNRSLLAHGIQKLDRDATGKILEKARKLFSRMLEIEGTSEAEAEEIARRHTFLSEAL